MLTIKVSGENLKDFNLKSFKFLNPRYQGELPVYCFNVYSNNPYWNYCTKIVFEDLDTFNKPVSGDCPKDREEQICPYYLLDFIFEFPDDYPEEDLFYFKMKYS